MGKLYESITPELQKWIEKQKMFFVATAPLASQGHVNCSPKGLDSLRVLGPQSVAYQDLTGSGIETVAQVKENGRIVLMLCAFEGPPKIVRLYGRGRVIERGMSEFDEFARKFLTQPSTRSFVQIEINRISDSCGYGVPLFDYVGDRDTLTTFSDKMGDQALADYRAKNNRKSIDGLVGLSGE